MSSEDRSSPAGWKISLALAELRNYIDGLVNKYAKVSWWEAKAFPLDLPFIGAATRKCSPQLG